jgi:hypothetical protein
MEGKPYECSADIYYFPMFQRDQDICRVQLVNCLERFGRGSVGNCAKLAFDQSRSKTHLAKFDRDCISTFGSADWWNIQLHVSVGCFISY